MSAKAAPKAAPKAPKEAAKTAKPSEPAAKPPKEAPKPVKEAPKAAKEAPKPATEAPKPAKEAPKPAKEAPKPAKGEAVKPSKDAKPAKEAVKPVKEAMKLTAKDGKAPAKAPPKAPAPKAAAPKAAAPKAAAPKAAAPKAAAPKAAAPKAAAPKAAAPKKETKASTGIYIKNWGRSGVEVAKALFGGFGKLTAIRLRRGRFCQVWFDSPVTAKKAMDTVKKDKRGKDLQIVPAKSQPKTNKREGTRVVCVKPIYRQSVSRKRLLTYFGETGKVVKLRTYVNNTVYVYYDSSVAAAKTISEKNGQQFMNHTLTIAPSVRSIEADKKKEEKRRVLIDLHRWVKAQPKA